MPWVRAQMKGNVVYARADAAGELLVESGRVEIRYNANDGRMYRAAARNLTVVDATPLPDDACGSAEAVEKSAKKTTSKKKSKKSSSRGPARQSEPVAGRAIAYTDGACSGNPGPAGLGVVVLCGDERIELSEYLGQATNNIAELTGILRALEAVDAAIPALVHTDSQYSIGVLQKGWKAKANQELIATIRRAMELRDNVTLIYVKGHAGIELNEKADELARLAVETRRTTENRRQL